MKLLRHSVYNLLGLGLPLVVAIFTIPVLIKELGEARFGLLTLIWAVVSYFGLFDLGLGRALTQQLAVVLAKNEHDEVGPLVGTATVIMAVLGVIAGVLMAAAAPWGVGLINAVPDKQEAIHAVYAMALAMPAIVLTSGFRGILEARHAFGVINLIRLPMGLFTFLGPLVAVFLGYDRLDIIAIVLAVGRLIASIVHAFFAWRVLPDDHGKLRLEKCVISQLCISGGWMSISNLVSSLMGYIDRFILGAVVSAAAISYYSVPNEMITKLWIIPAAFTSVLFPSFAINGKDKSESQNILFLKAIKWIGLTIFPICFILAYYSEFLLVIWVNQEFAEKSFRVLQVLALGMAISALASIPYTVIQAIGRQKITAAVHLVELPIFVVMIYMLSVNYGPIGAAWAWTARAIVDAAIMFILYFMSRRVR